MTRKVKVGCRSCWIWAKWLHPTSIRAFLLIRSSPNIYYPPCEPAELEFKRERDWQGLAGTEHSGSLQFSTCWVRIHPTVEIIEIHLNVSERV